MSDGRIYYAESEGNYYLKFVGDVRVTLCTTLSRYIDHIFAEPRPRSVVLDVRDAKAVDSTTLGFMAKVALYAQSKKLSPLLIARDKSMVRLAESMGFDEIFEIVPDFPVREKELGELKFAADTSEETRKKVIEAHRVLMSMNTKNMEAFSELVSALQQESEKQGGER